MLLLAVAAALPCASGEPERFALHAARLLDVEHGTVLEDALVVVEGETIVGVGPRATLVLAAETRVDDLGDVTLLPGLVDAHVHLAWGAPGAGGAEIPGANEALATLNAGITTVRNLGSTAFADLTLRDAIAAGTVPGPRMLVAGPALGAPGGTCDGVFAGEGVVHDAAEARARVRELAERGVDVVKYCSGGGVLATPVDQDVCELPLEIQRAIVAEAHELGLRVAAHAQGPRAIRTAVEAGVDSIEHGGLIDEAAAKAMKEHGTVLVPTLHRMTWKLEQAERAGAPVEALAQLEEAARITLASAKRAVALGVPIACGTDATVLPHGLNARELSELVRIGLTPAQAVRAATIDAARLLGLEAEIGSITAKKRADLIAVRGNPLDDVRVLEDVPWVMQAGKVVKNAVTGSR